MSRTALALSLAAALLFAVGGVFMKMSNGLERLVIGALAIGLFLVGAVVQTLALKHADLGVAYVFVLGLEAVLAFGFGALFFEEAVSATKVLGVSLIIAGFAFLHLGAPAAAP